MPFCCSCVGENSLLNRIIYNQRAPLYGPFNSSVLLDPNAICWIYRVSHSMDTDTNESNSFVGSDHRASPLTPLFTLLSFRTPASVSHVLPRRLGYAALLKHAAYRKKQKI